MHCADEAAEWRESYEYAAQSNTDPTTASRCMPFLNSPRSGQLFPLPLREPLSHSDRGKREAFTIGLCDVRVMLLQANRSSPQLATERGALHCTRESHARYDLQARCVKYKRGSSWQLGARLSTRFASRSREHQRSRSRL